MYETVALPLGNSLRFSSENRFHLPKSTGSRSRTVRCPAPAASWRASVQTFPAEPQASGSAVRRRPASLYDVLRVSETASPREIKTAYRSLAKMYHPDASSASDDGKDFIEIHNAYAKLSDPTARAIYDLTLGVQRRRVVYGSAGRPVRGYTTRRWETDQCW